MSDSSALDFTLVHAGTAAALSQILPLLLLALLVEVRRARPGWCRRIRTRGMIIGFLLCFGVIETVFVISIDGSLMPYRWSDLLAALSIFVLLAILCVLALSDPPTEARPNRRRIASIRPRRVSRRGARVRTTAPHVIAHRGLRRGATDRGLPTPPR